MSFSFPGEQVETGLGYLTYVETVNGSPLISGR
jgi:hypothetical protein